MANMKFFCGLLVLALATPLMLQNADATTTAPQRTDWNAPGCIFVHGALPASITDGTHLFRVFVYNGDSAVIFADNITATVAAGSYAFVLGTGANLGAPLSTSKSSIRVEVDSDGVLHDVEQESTVAVSAEANIFSALQVQQLAGVAAILKDEGDAEHAIEVARRSTIMGARLHSALAALIPYDPPTGLHFEASVAPPADNTPTDPYQLAKYGRLNLEYKNFATIGGNSFGLAAQAMHVAHHLLLYSAGLTSDINNDGMFTFTAGYTMYQTGQSRAEPFVSAPFFRFRFISSPTDVFVYSEVESTVQARSFISSMVGLGLMVAPGVRFITGFQHTEFVMPTEQMVRQVNGIEGTFMWGVG